MKQANKEQEFIRLGRQGVPFWLMEKNLDQTELQGAQVSC